MRSFAPATGLDGIMQIAWVTPDIEHSLSQFREMYRVQDFYRMDLDFPARVFGESGPMKLKMALANVDNIQLELIQPTGGGIDRIYRDVLPADGSHANILHHVCIKIEGTLADWDDHVSRLGSSRPVVYVGDAGPDVRFLYTDDRPTLGVYVEHLWRSPSVDAAMNAAIPTYVSGHRQS
jgi:hypothetical protein